MTFTYASTSLTTDLAKVRRLIGDTSSGSAEFTDEEVNFFIGEEGTIYGAASLACESLAAVYADKVDKSAGDLSISLSHKYEHYKTLGEQFRVTAKSKGAPALYAGGISVSDKDTQESDSDRVTPDFYKEQFDYQGTTISSTQS